MSIFSNRVKVVTEAVSVTVAVVVGKVSISFESSRLDLRVCISHDLRYLFHSFYPANRIVSISWRPSPTSCSLNREAPCICMAGGVAPSSKTGSTPLQLLRILGSTDRLPFAAKNGKNLGSKAGFPPRTRNRPRDVLPNTKPLSFANR